MADGYPAVFPTSLDSYTECTDNTTAITANHPNSRGSAIAAIEAKVGIDSSAVATSHDYLLRNLPGQAGNWDAGTVEVRALNFESDTTTAIPYQAASGSLKCTNLDVDMVDGKHVAGTNGAGEITTNDGTQTLTNKTLGGNLNCNDKQLTNLILETRTNDTGMTVEGQIWFRSDVA